VSIARKMLSRSFSCETCVFDAYLSCTAIELRIFVTVRDKLCSFCMASDIFAQDWLCGFLNGVSNSAVKTSARFKFHNDEDRCYSFLWIRRLRYFYFKEC